MLDRIKALMAVRQLSPSQFADLATLPRPVVSHILSGRNKPSLEVAQKIMTAFPDVSIDWLLNGRGAMLSGAPIVSAEPVPANVPAPAVTSGPDPAAPTRATRMARPRPAPVAPSTAPPVSPPQPYATPGHQVPPPPISPANPVIPAYPATPAAPYYNPSDNQPPAGPSAAAWATVSPEAFYHRTSHRHRPHLPLRMHRQHLTHYLIHRRRRRRRRRPRPWR